MTHPIYEAAGHANLAAAEKGKQVLTTTNNGAVFTREIAGQPFVYGPVFESEDEAERFLSWLHDQSIDPADLSDSGMSYRLSLFRETATSESVGLHISAKKVMQNGRAYSA